MAYSELLKNFEKIRSYMRQFYVYGFKTRKEYDSKSRRSYDNERRRIESWLSDHMSFHRDASGKNVFLSVDSRKVKSNPLYQAFQAKSFTNGDISFHFYLLDLLSDHAPHSIREILAHYTEKSSLVSETPVPVDESTVRKKLKEYEMLGIITSGRMGKELRYALAKDTVNPESFRDAIAFYTEAAPLGVIGSYLSYRFDRLPDVFRFKHHYILHALDSDILYRLLLAIREAKLVDLSLKNPSGEFDFTVCPIKIYHSTQTGREYLYAFYPAEQRPIFFRLDYLVSVKIKQRCENIMEYRLRCEDHAQYLWGVSFQADAKIHRVEMDIRIEDDEMYILNRLKREKRLGKDPVQIQPNVWRYTAFVFDPIEMMPWIRTFIGRIERLYSTDPRLTERFYADLAATFALYEKKEDDDAVS